MIRFLLKHDWVCMHVCVRVRGLMTALSAESGTQEGISRHCISKAQPLETRGRVFLMRGGTGVCVCAVACESVWVFFFFFGWVTVYANLDAYLRKQPTLYILYFVTAI